MEASGYADIIFFAALAGFILFKLYSTLGRHDGDGNIASGADVIHPIGKGKKTASPTAGKKEQSVVTPIKGVPEPDVSAKIAKKLESIKMADIGFSAGDFLVGATAAFEMVFQAFCEGDEQTLKNLLSKEIYQEFVKEIDKRNKAKKKDETTLVSIVAGNIVDAGMENNKAKITISFISEQINVTKDAKGKIIAGDPSQIDEIKDVWVFEKNIKSSNPNWTIVAT